MKEKKEVNLPLKFTDYPNISKKTLGTINAHAQSIETTKNGKVLLRGFYLTGIDYIERYLQALAIRDNLRGNSIAGFGGNKNELFIFTWTEGDTTITLCQNEKEYIEEMNTQTSIWNKED